MTNENLNQLIRLCNYQTSTNFELGYRGIIGHYAALAKMSVRQFELARDKYCISRKVARRRQRIEVCNLRGSAT
ncbi:MAG: hypothetical protein KGL39_49395 [Patescibacteria group bacterium]|nr:hypothetical protein [Patescibacteria group bacterium]